MCFILVDRSRLMVRNVSELSFVWFFFYKTNKSRRSDRAEAWFLGFFFNFWGKCKSPRCAFFICLVQKIETSALWLFAKRYCNDLMQNKCVCKFCECELFSSIVIISKKLLQYKCVARPVSPCSIGSWNTACFFFF